jgi:hypothetical protein
MEDRVPDPSTMTSHQNIGISYHNASDLILPLIGFNRKK